MSKSLSISPNWSDTKGIVDPIDSRSWSNLTITVGDTTITEVADVNNEIPRTWIGVPAFPIVEWLVFNWWSLLYEPVRTEQVFRPAKWRKEADFWWIKRHCMRAADSSLLLPQLYFYNNGRGVAARWFQDEAYQTPHEAYQTPHFLSQFIAENGTLHLSLDDVRSKFSYFVSSVLERVQSIDNIRITDVSETWQAIQAARLEEFAFCVIAGRMGLNPYDPTEVTIAVGQVIDRIIEMGADLPINLDLTEVASTEYLESDLAWIREVSNELSIGPSKPNILPPVTIANKLSKPYDFGYRTAKWIRRHLKLDDESPVSSVVDSVSRFLNKELQVVDRNHLTDNMIAGIVGWSDREQPVIAGPKRQDQNERFRIARGGYHAMCSCSDSQRLLTTANTWDQQASRAFAAEFLAPQNSVLREYENGSTIQDLASHYDVSDLVINLQLQNAGGLFYE